MIPLRLTLKNFLSYGPVEQTISFESYSLMCLSGKNGHGKSSILDALTWAIWGAARKMVGVAKGDDGLVHLGQKEMVVHLEFLVNAQKYRIRREYFKSYGKPVTRLDVEVFDSALGQFVTLTDKSVRATQEKIERIVGLDFETFVSTSFLRQGQSNEFSKKTPRERKEVIASILGLGAYDQKAMLAQEKSKDLLQKISLIKVQADQARTIVAQIPQIEERLSFVLHELERVARELHEEQQKGLVIAQRVQQVELVGEEVKRLRLHLDSLESSEFTLKKHIKDKFLSWRQLHKRLLSLPSFDVLMLERTAALAAFKEVQDKEKKTMVLQQKIEEARRKYEALEVGLRHEHELRKTTLLRKKDEVTGLLKYQAATLLDVVSRKDVLGKQLMECRQKQGAIIAQLATREQIEAAYDVGKRLFEKRRSFYHACVSKKNVATTALAELTAHKKTVSNVENPSCPLCQQLVTLKRKQFLVYQLSKQERFQEHKLGRVNLVLQHLESTLKAQRNELEKEARVCLSLQAAEHDLARIGVQVQELEREYAVFCEREAELGVQKIALTKDLFAIEQEYVALDALFQASLLSNDVILVEKATVAQAQQELAGIGYSASELEKASLRVSSLEASLRDLQQRDVLSGEALRVRHAIVMAITELRRARKELGELKPQYQGLVKKMEDAPQITEEKRLLDARVQSLLAKRDELSRELGSLTERKKRCDEAAESNKQVDAQVDALLHEKKEYDLLVDAYGKNGIQALLIESVLPEIEQEANTLLARLTDNQMQIFIESLRDLKGGGVRETLDIQISDAVGVRPYEMFSGGEAFRIDFALRIAVSRLLARRAGTHLQTLLIDEGFGSQDDEGLARLTHALFAVQKDFEKIIVVSHLERLKESFPVHVIVEKRAGSSVVHVEERG